jgi:hypothetical protein
MKAGLTVKEGSAGIPLHKRKEIATFSSKGGYCETVIVL